MTKTTEERITEFKTLYSGLNWTDLHADDFLARIEQIQECNKKLIEENNKFRSDKIRDLEEENKRLKEKLETMKSGLEKLKKVKITDPILIAEVFLEQLNQ